MKSTDIAAAIMIAIASTAIAYFLGNAFLGDPNDESVSVSYMDPIAATVAQPDPEVFNNEAINPTVEVFVGNCKDGEVWDPETGSCVTILPPGMRRRLVWRNLPGPVRALRTLCTISWKTARKRGLRKIAIKSRPARREIRNGFAVQRSSR